MINVSDVKVGDIIVPEDPGTHRRSYEPSWNPEMRELVDIEYEVVEVDRTFYEHSVAIIDDYGSRWLIDLDYAHFAAEQEIELQKLNMSELF